MRIPWVWPEEQCPFQQALVRVLDLQQQLEATRQRRCSQGMLRRLLDDLHYVTREVRRAPCSQARAAQLELAEHLRTAAMALLLALERIVVHGRTYRFYRYLALCQDALAEALLVCRRETAEVSYGQPAAGRSAAHIQRHCAAMQAWQAALERERRALAEHDGVSSDGYSALLAALVALSAPATALCGLLADVRQRLDDPRALCEQLQIHLCYIDAQIQRLVAFISSMQTLAGSGSRRARKARLEISLTLDALLQCSDAVPQTVSALLERLRSVRSKAPWLRLVPAPADPERQEGADAWL